MPDPIITPHRQGSSFEKSIPESTTASTPADLRELDEAIKSLDVLGRDVAVGRPTLDFAAEADLVIGYIQPLERTDSALALADASPKLLHLAAERGDGADTRDDDAAFHASSQAEDASVLSTALLMWSMA